MAVDVPVSYVHNVVSPHLSPTVYSYSTPDLASLLQDNGITSTAALLQPYSHSVDKIQLRTATFTNLALDRFPFHLVERSLPPSLFPPTATPSTTTRQRSGSLAHQSANLTSTPVPSTPLTPYHHPSQLERDDLFLDSLGHSLIRTVDSHLADPALPPPLEVRPTSVPRRLPEQGAEPLEPDVDARQEGWEGKTVEQLAPWFRQLRDDVFRRRELVEWETFNWPVACLLCLSTAHPDPLNALSALWDLTSPASLFAPSSYPPRSGAEEDGRHEWASPDVLRFVVLVHDWGAGGGQEGWEDAQTLHDTIRKTYGLHTALVPLFSASPSAAKPQPPAEAAAAMYAHLAVSPSAAASQAQTKEEVVGLGYEDEPSASSSSGAAAPDAPDHPAPVPGAHLSTTDLQSLSKLTRSLLVQSILPHLERTVVVGNEQFVASRRGLGGRLWGAGRKYFGGGGGGGGEGRASPGPEGKGGWNAQRGYYHHTSPLSQTRRLADLAFMLADYKLAAQVYEQAAKDFRGDKAWRYYAAAVRMQGLSLLLQHPTSLPLPPPGASSSPDSFLSLAALAPSPASPTLPSFDALRSTLLFYELYRSFPPSSHAWGLAPAALVRAAGEAEEVAAAVLLEQAALADLRGEARWGRGGKRRRWALHLAMAAARYEKCGVKSLSRRCLAQLSTLYTAPVPLPSLDTSPPPVALTALSDPRIPPPPSPSSRTANTQPRTFPALHTHINHALARQSYTAHAPAVACRHFLRLLEPAAAPLSIGEGAQEDQLDWLDDFQLAWELLRAQAAASGAQEDDVSLAAREGLRLPEGVTVFDAARATVVVGSVGAAGASAGGEGEGWGEMEKDVVDRAGWEGKRPGRLEYRGGEGSGEAVLGELFHLELPVQNPLEAFLAIGGLSIETDAEEGALEIEAPQEVELAPGERSKIFVPIRATALGTFTVLSLSYRFANLLPVVEPLTLRFSTPSAPTPVKPSVRSAVPLQIRVRSAVPVLSVCVDGLPAKMFHGETVRARLTVENKGGVPLADVQALCSHPSFALVSPSSSSSSSGELYGPSSATPATAPIPNHLAPRTPTALLPPGEALQPGETKEVKVLCRGDEVGAWELRWLFAFRAGESDATEYFTTRVVHRVEVYPSLKVRCSARPNAKEGSPFLLSIEAFNAGLPASDAQLTSVALLSPRWALSLPASTLWEEDIAAPLGWHQGTRFDLAVDAAPGAVGEGLEGQGDEAMRFTEERVKALLQGKELGKTGPGEIDVRVTNVSAPSTAPPDVLSGPLYPSLLSTLTASRRASLSTSLPLLPSTLHASLFPLLPSLSSAHLLLFYTSPTLRTSGHLVLPLSPSLGLTSAPRDAPLRAVLDAAERTAGGGLYEESQRERAALLSALRRSELAGGAEGKEPVAVRVEVDEVGQHDFSARPCTPPIRFHLRNLSPTTPLSYTLSLDSPSPRGAVLAGALTHRGALPPLAQTAVSTKLWIPRPGSYRAGEWRLAVQTAAEGDEKVSWALQGAAVEVKVRDTAAGRGDALAHGQMPAGAAVVEVQA
ncbi:hypothetical protein JCM10207_004953 [Rhodosporidiobolus poonsookiae]